MFRSQDQILCIFCQQFPCSSRRENVRCVRTHRQRQNDAQTVGEPYLFKSREGIHTFDWLINWFCRCLKINNIVHVFKAICREISNRLMQESRKSIKECLSYMRSNPNHFSRRLQFYNFILHPYFSIKNAGLQKTFKSFVKLQRTLQNFIVVHRTSEKFEGLQIISQNFRAETAIEKIVIVQAKCRGSGKFAKIQNT